MAETYANHDPIKVITTHFSAIRLPRELKEQLLCEITRWYNSNGAKYTVERLKFVKQCCVNYLASGELPPKQNDVWFKRNKQGLLYGPWSTLMKLTLSQPQEVMKLAMCYSAFATDSEPTERSLKKFKNMVEKPFQGDCAVRNEIKFYLFRDSVSILKQYLPHEKRYLVSRDISRPKPYLYARLRSRGHKTDVIKSTLDKIYQPKFYNLMLQNRWMFDVFNDEPMVDKFNHLENLGVCNYCNTYMGNVNVINEPALKERIVTDFHKPFEHVTLPLGQRLYDLIEAVPWDTTFHEDHGYAVIQKKLSEGHKAVCHDMTNATDRFPFEWQKGVMMALAKDNPLFKEQMDILFQLLEWPAILPNGKTVKWAVGQPMGAFPSFAMFSLTHGLLLMQYLYSKGESYNYQFIVHGDDIVIFDPELAEYYEIVMSYADVPNNEFKTLVSDSIAEFNSRLITKDGFIYMRKYRPITLDSVLDQVSYWGPKCINWLEHKKEYVHKGQRRVKWLNHNKKVKQLVSTILTVPGIMPDGTSINPLGLSIGRRIMRMPKEVLDIIFTKDVKAKELVSNRDIALSHLRSPSDIENYSRYHKHPEKDRDWFEGDVYEGDRILQFHLGSLDFADALDREFLQDSTNFLNFFSLANKGLNPLADYADDSSNQTFSIAQSMIECAGHMALHWDEVIGVDYNHRVSLNGIRSYNTRVVRRNQVQSKLYKCINYYTRKARTKSNA